MNVQAYLRKAAEFFDDPTPQPAGLEDLPERLLEAADEITFLRLDLHRLASKIRRWQTEASIVHSHASYLLGDTSDVLDGEGGVSRRSFSDEDLEFPVEGFIWKVGREDLQGRGRADTWFIG